MRISDLFGRFAVRKDAPPGLRFLRLWPEQGPIYAIGDAHGCKMLLHRLVELILQDAAGFDGTPTLVLLGDMIDRGPDSAGVLDDMVRPGTLRLGQTNPVHAILGNHERMMLSFFADPHRNANWLERGGFETLMSYGLAMTAQEAVAIPKRRLSQILAAHVPHEHLDWMAALPHGFGFNIDGTEFRLVHAGYDPNLADAVQREDVVIWGRPPTAPTGAAPGNLRIVQGHTVVRKPDTDSTVIRIDTGAWQNGTLTALRLVSGCSPHGLSYDAGRHMT